MIKRLCKTLNKSVDVGRSEIQLLVDFIVVKLQKQEADPWSDFGYDIANFTVPQTGQMKSNFLKSIEPAPAVEPEVEETKVPEKTPEEIEAERQEKI